MSWILDKEKKYSSLYHWNSNQNLNMDYRWITITTFFNIVFIYLLAVPGLSCSTWDLVPCCCLVAQSCLTLCDPMDCSHQAPLSMEFSRQEYWRGMPRPSPGDLQESNLGPLHWEGGEVLITGPPRNPINTSCLWLKNEVLILKKWSLQYLKMTSHNVSNLLFKQFRIKTQGK